MAQGSWAYIQFFDQPGGHPDQGLPGRPGRPGGLPGFPDAPGHPGHLPSRPGRPGRPVDPDYGVDEGEGGGEDAGQLPVWPLDPEHPDVGLPPVAGQPLPPVDPPPGTVWPPLDLPGVPEGKALVLAAVVSSTGHKKMHYFVVDIPEGSGGQPDQGLPGEGEEGPDQELPSPQPPRPPRPGQGLPGQRPPGQPPQPGQGLPGQRPGQRPPTAGQLPTRPGAPPRPQPK
jgi:hypothetical protein